MIEHAKPSGLAALPSEAAFHRSVQGALLGSGEGTGERSRAGGTAATAQGSDALAKQVGGEHYKSLAIQPIEYIQANGLDYFQGNVLKYVTRHKSKSGAADVRKAIHYLQLILKLQYGVDE